MDQPPRLPEEDQDIRPSRSRLSRRARLTIALVVLLLLVIILLHLTGVINESNAGH